VLSVVWHGTLTENESATHELSNACIFEGGSRNDRAQQDDHRADEHTPATTPRINSGTDEGKSNDTSDLVHGRHDTSPNSSVGAMEESLELRVDEQAVEQTSIVAVHGSRICVSHGQREGWRVDDLLAQTAKKSACEEKDGGRAHQSGVLSHQCIVESSATSNGLDMLVVCIMGSDSLLDVSVARRDYSRCTVQQGLRPHSSRPSSWLKMVSSTTW